REVFRSPELAGELVRGSFDEGTRQRMAEVLFAGVRPAAPPRHEVDPAFERRRRLEAHVRLARSLLWLHARGGGKFRQRDERTGRWQFRPEWVAGIARLAALDKDLKLRSEALGLSGGERLTPEHLARLEPGFTPERLAVAMTRSRMVELTRALCAY